MRDLLRREGLEDVVEVDSAGIGGWHAGEPPDERAARTAAARGVTLDGAARQVARGDFERHDLLLAMDRENRDALLALAPDAAGREKVRLLREFDPEAVRSGDLDVPDPYYGGPRGFDRVLDLVEDACEGLLGALRADGRV